MILLESFWFSINAIIPIIFFIFLGYILRKKAYIDKQISSILNKYIFYFGLPALFFFNVYNIKTLKNIDLSKPILLSIAILVIYFLSFLFKSKKNDSAIIRIAMLRTSYAMIGVTLVSFFSNDVAFEYVGITSIFVIPVVNTLTLVLLFRKEDYEKNNQYIFKLLKEIFLNPLQVSIFLGLIFVLGKTFLIYSNGQPIILIERDIPFMYTIIRLFSITASPIALLSLGSQFDLSEVKKNKKEILLSITLRNIVIPVLMVSVVTYLSYLDKSYIDIIPSIIAVFASPVAASTLVLVERYKQNSVLAGQIVVWTTICSSVTLFVILTFLRIINLI